MIATKLTVSSAATAVADGGTTIRPMIVTISVPSGGVTVFIGGATVNATQGFPIAAGQSITLQLASDALYAIVASGTQDINVLAQ